MRKTDNNFRKYTRLFHIFTIPNIRVGLLLY